MLPELPDAYEILICNTIGETIAQVKYHQEFSLKWLPKGFYLVYVLNKKDEKNLMGTILK